MKVKVLDDNFREAKDFSDACYGVFENGDIELYTPYDTAYPVITREEILKLAEILKGDKMSRKDEIKEEIAKKRKEIEDLERERQHLPASVDKVDVYLHSDKESMFQQGNEAGLSDKQLELFVYACSEIKVTLAVNEDGEAEIIAVDDRQLKEEE